MNFINSVLYKLTILFLLLLTSYFLLLHPSCVFAQSLSLSVSPPLIEIMIKPGKSAVQSFKLKNLGDDSLINTQIVPFNEKGLILDSLEKTVPWMQIISPEKPFVLKKDEEKDVLLKINPGTQTKEQDYYQALMFKTAPLSDLRNSQSIVQQSVSALVITSVTSSGLSKSAAITDFNLPSLIDSFSGININLKVKNTGNTFFHTNGNLILKGAIGEIKYPLIPRIFMSGQEKELLIDDKTPNKITGFFLGKYTLKTDFVLDWMLR